VQFLYTIARFFIVEKRNVMDKTNLTISYLEKIISLMPGNVYWKDRTGKYLGCNDNLAKILKLPSRHAIAGKTIFDLANATLAKTTEKIDNDIMNKGQEMILEEPGIDINGHPSVYLTKKTPLYDEHNKVIGLLGVSIDITERKKMEEELRIAREKEKSEEIFSLRKIISLMPGNVYWKDKQGNYLGCNDNFAKIIGLSSAEEAIGKNDLESIGKQLTDTISKTDREIMLSKQEQLVEELGFNINKDPAIYLSRKMPLKNIEGHITGILGISIDITDRKKMEEELRIAKEKAEAALRAKEIAEAESREKSVILKDVLKELNKKRYYLSDEDASIYLTQREAECMLCLANGNSAKEIGKHLKLSPRTVEVHINRMKIKLNCKTKSELIRIAIKCRFLDGIRPVV
jgi:PAS domain S-box-containing protein